ncbi:alpha/beta-hydrolase, partial [Rhizophagus irregularis]
MNIIYRIHHIPNQNWDCGEVCQATAAFIALVESQKLIIILYRGTVPGSFKNLFTDANFITKDYHPTDGLRVHRGFYNAFLEMQPDVTDDVVNLHQERLDFRIGFMGHSLGGALATFSALDFVQKVPELANNEKITLKSVRTIVRGDPIPRLPPGIPLPFVGLYKHFGEELYINNLDQDPNEFTTYNAEDPNCSESVPLTQLRLKTCEATIWLAFSPSKSETSNKSKLDKFLAGENITLNCFISGEGVNDIFDVETPDANNNQVSSM